MIAESCVRVRAWVLGFPLGLRTLTRWAFRWDSDGRGDGFPLGLGRGDGRTRGRLSAGTRTRTRGRLSAGGCGPVKTDILGHSNFYRGYDYIVKMGTNYLYCLTRY